MKREPFRKRFVCINLVITRSVLRCSIYETGLDRDHHNGIVQGAFRRSTERRCPLVWAYQCLFAGYNQARQHFQNAFQADGEHQQFLEGMYLGFIFRESFRFNDDFL